LEVKEIKIKIDIIDVLKQKQQQLDNNDENKKENNKENIRIIIMFK
jgi:hypothetical protein